MLGELVGSFHFLIFTCRILSSSTVYLELIGCPSKVERILCYKGVIPMPGEVEWDELQVKQARAKMKNMSRLQLSYPAV